MPYIASYNYPLLPDSYFSHTFFLGLCTISTMDFVRFFRADRSRVRAVLGCSFYVLGCFSIVLCSGFTFRIPKGSSGVSGCFNKMSSPGKTGGVSGGSLRVSMLGFSTGLAGEMSVTSTTGAASVSLFPHPDRNSGRTRESATQRNRC